jgi:hypothetical protein
MTRPISSLAIFLLLSLPLHAANSIEVSNEVRTAAASAPEFDVASSGDGYLAVWTSYTPPRFIYTAPITSAGEVPAVGTLLDPSSTARGIAVSAARNGDFVTYVSDRGLEVATLDATGSLLRHAIVTPLTSFYGTHTAWDGGLHLVLGSGSSVWGVAVDDDANLVGSPFRIPNAEALAGQSLVPHTGEFDLLGLRESNGLKELILIRLSSSGGVAPPRILATVPISTYAVRATALGTSMLVAWSNEQGLWMISLDAQGAPVAPPRLIVESSALTLAGMTTFEREARLSYTMDHVAYVVAVREDSSVGATRRVAGTSAGILTSDRQGLLHVPHPDGFSRYANLVEPSATEPVLVTRNAAQQLDLTLSASTDHLLAAWSEPIDGAGRIYTSRLTRARTLAGASVPISSKGDNTRPSAAWNGREWLVVWMQREGETTRIVGRRLDAKGEPVEAEEFVIAEPIPEEVRFALRPRVASDGSGWLVVWNGGVRFPDDCPTCLDHFGSGVFGGRITDRGAVLDPGGVMLVDRPDQEYAVDVAWSGDRYVLTWINYTFGFRGQSSRAVAAETVTRDLLTSAYVTLTPGYTPLSGYSLSDPKISAGGGEALIAWNVSRGVTVTTHYASFPSDRIAGPPRRRAVSNAGEPRSIDGSLLATGFDPATALFSILALTPNALLETIVENGVTVGVPRKHTVLAWQAITTDELIPFAGMRWLGQTRFVPALGSMRGAFVAISD